MLYQTPPRCRLHHWWFLVRSLDIHGFRRIRSTRKELRRMMYRVQTHHHPPHSLCPVDSDAGIVIDLLVLPT